MTPTAQPNTKPARGRMPAEERRATIVQAAGRLFAERGYAGARLDDIAAAAGVTKPILYRHFSSKKDLYLALMAKHRDDLPGFVVDVTAGEGAAATGALAEQQVWAMLDAWLAYAREHPHNWVMLFRDGGGDEDVRAFRAEVHERAREVIAELLRARSAIAEPQVEPTAEIIRSGLAGMVLWWIDHPDTPRATLADAATRVVAGTLSPAGLR